MVIPGQYGTVTLFVTSRSKKENNSETVNTSPMVTERLQHTCLLEE